MLATCKSLCDKSGQAHEIIYACLCKMQCLCLPLVTNILMHQFGGCGLAMGSQLTKQRKALDPELLQAYVQRDCCATFVEYASQQVQA